MLFFHIIFNTTVLGLPCERC